MNLISLSLPLSSFLLLVSLPLQCLCTVSKTLSLPFFFHCSITGSNLILCLPSPAYRQQFTGNDEDICKDRTGRRVGRGGLNWDVKWRKRERERERNKHTRGSQRPTSGIPPHLPSCLRQDLVCVPISQSSWPMKGSSWKVSCICLPPRLL
jgi:hypothetical protein